MTRATTARLPRPRPPQARRASRLRAVHEHQLTLGLGWPDEELRARRHLALLHGGATEPEPIPVTAFARKAKAA